MPDAIAGITESLYLPNPARGHRSPNGEEDLSIGRGARTMADESKLVDAILAAYNEEHAHFIKSFAIMAELVPDLVEEGLI